MLLGDLVSIYLAVLRGVDPGPVKVIDELKAALAETLTPPASATRGFEPMATEDQR